MFTPSDQPTDLTEQERSLVHYRVAWKKFIFQLTQLRLSLVFRQDMSVFLRKRVSFLFCSTFHKSLLLLEGHIGQYVGNNSGAYGGTKRADGESLTFFENQFLGKLKSKMRKSWLAKIFSS